MTYNIHVATHVAKQSNKNHASFYFGEQVKSILKYLYPVPKDESRRVITFANQADYISFRCVINEGLLGVLGNRELDNLFQGTKDKSFGNNGVY